MSLTGTRPTVGLIYVGLAKAIGGTPTAIALLYKTGGRESHPANGDHTADRRAYRPECIGTMISERAGMGPNSGEVYLS